MESGGELVDIKFELDASLNENDVVIRARKLTPEIERMINEMNQTTLLVRHRGEDKTIDLNLVYFFETDQEVVYAHTATHAYETRYRLYELEKELPHHYLRISKSTILNIKHISAIERGLTSNRSVSFIDTHKIVYVSRMYYPLLKEKLRERSL